MIVLILFLATMGAIGLCMHRGITGETSAGAAAALAGGLGAGLGVVWKFVLGLGGAGLVADAGFIAAGLLLTFGALHYGRRIRRLRAEAAATSPETFE